MTTRFDESEEDERATTFCVPLDDATVARLIELSDICHMPPTLLIASIIHDVLKDDEDAHGFEREKPNHETTLN